MYIPSLYTYICTHGEVQNANGCWSATSGCLSATCSCLSATQGIYVHTYSHVQMVTNKIMEKKVGKLSVFFHISPYSTCICYFIEKTCMYAMKKCIEEYRDHAVEIHTFAMNVLLGQFYDPPPPNPHWTYFFYNSRKTSQKVNYFFFYN